MDAELEAQRSHAHAVIGALQTVADGMPALGIVAAVLGVITRWVPSPTAGTLGRLIGGALVGTFTGVLVAYGIVAPIAKSLENTHAGEADYLQCIKTALIAHLQGYAPQVSIEFARKLLTGKVRPTFAELDEAVQAVKLP